MSPRSGDPTSASSGFSINADGVSSAVSDAPFAARMGLRLGTVALLHPFDYAKTLMQIGHEPIAPSQTKTLFTRNPALGLPSVARYG